jgi:hypothetical protein
VTRSGSRGLGKKALTRVAVVLAISLVGILIAAPGASAQGAIDEYIPQANPAGGTGGQSAGSGSSSESSKASLGAEGAIGGHGSVAAESGSGSGGNLPFTGYPVTPIVWIVAALLIAGLLVRLSAPLLGRGEALKR